MLSHKQMLLKVAAIGGSILTRGLEERGPQGARWLVGSGAVKHPSAAESARLHPVQALCQGRSPKAGGQPVLPRTPLLPAPILDLRTTPNSPHVGPDWWKGRLPPKPNMQPEVAPRAIEHCTHCFWYALHFLHPPTPLGRLGYPPTCPPYP